MNKKIILLLVLIVGICAVSGVCAEDSSDCLAQNQDNIEIEAADADESLIGLDDEINQQVAVGEKTDSADKDFSDVYRQIESANDGDTIYLNGSYICDFPVIINKSITLEGKDSAVLKYNQSSSEMSSFIYINYTASNVVLRNLEFVDGNFLWGGAVSWMGDNGSIINCTFRDNQAIGNNAIGGAVLIGGNNCKITDSKFENNIADRNGAAILWSGDGGSISNCEFKSNNAQGDDGLGGAILMLGNNCNVTNSSFKNNRAYLNGGAINWQGIGGLISNCIFESNEARSTGDKKSLGGALFLSEGNCIVENSNFTKNHASYRGGAIYAKMNNVTVVKCGFDENVASCNNNTEPGGGAIFSNCNNLTIDDSTFNKNRAPNSYGGAVVLAKSDNAVKNSYFNGNSAIDGNDIFTLSSDISFNYFVIDYNETNWDAVLGYLTVDELKSKNNTFYKIKIKSVVKFDAVLVFNYREMGSIPVTVDGGIIEKVNIRVLNHKEAKVDIWDDVIYVSNLDVGTYTLRVTTTPDENHTASYGDLKVTVKKAVASIKADSVTVPLKKGKFYFKVKITDSRTGKGISGVKVTIKIKNGKKWTSVKRTTNAIGEVSVKTSGLKKGSHKVVVIASHKGYKFPASKSSSIKVVKPVKLTFTNKEARFKNGTTAMFRAYKDKTKKTSLNNVKVYLKVYKGKKLIKTYVKKTRTYKNKKGIVAMSTNELPPYKYTVYLIPVSVQYYGSKAKCSLQLDKKQVTYEKYTTFISG